MWTGEPALLADVQRICAAEYIPWDRLRGKTVCITGATGLIGTTLVNGLLYANEVKGLDVDILALVRDEARARKRFAAQLDATCGLRFAVGSVEDLPEIVGPVDYIIHGASQTASKAFVERPVETIATALHGTENMLELARKKQVKGFAYLSSMEVYGRPQRGHKVTEDEIGALSPLDVRNSYPISKQQCEALCCAYASEYGVPATIVRLTQTVGADIHEDDHRIFAEFRRCVLEKRDIVLRTKGETERSYLHTADAATAILTIMLVGQVGAAYNAADETTYCSIAQMAQLVAEKGGVKVLFDLQDEATCGYPPPLYMDLDTSRLKALGWEAGGLYRNT